LGVFFRILEPLVVHRVSADVVKSIQICFSVITTLLYVSHQHLKILVDTR